MDVSTVVNKKPCPVCVYLKAYPKELSLEVNNLIFSNSKYRDILEFLEKSKVLNVKQKPSEYFVEKHKIDCLSNFILKKVDNKNIPMDENCLISISLQSSLDEYEKMTVQERDNSHIERLRKIKYLSGVVILQELLNGSHKKSIPKEDISALKQIEDIVASIGEDNKLSGLNININDIGEDIE